MLLEKLALSRSTLDKVSDDRQDPALLERVLREPGTRYLLLHEGSTPVGRAADGTDRFALRLLGRSDVDGLVDGAVLVMLGRLRLMTDGGDAPALVAVLLDGGAALPDALLPDALLTGAGPVADWRGLREVGALLDDTDSGALTEATALAHWHATHTHCPRCGAPTTVAGAGHERRCPVDGSSHFPRHDPAVIMTVSDPAGRLLLGRQGRWPAGRFSAFAGFVEPGESLEQAVGRELYEEARVTVRRATYLGSQPWPFPASLMLAFHVETDDVVATPDGDEIVEARWFTRESLVGQLASGEVGLPPRLSVARRLVERWYGGEIPSGGVWR